MSFESDVERLRIGHRLSPRLARRLAQLEKQVLYRAEHTPDGLFDELGFGESQLALRGLGIEVRRKAYFEAFKPDMTVQSFRFGEFVGDKVVPRRADMHFRRIGIVNDTEVTAVYEGESISGTGLVYADVHPSYRDITGNDPVEPERPSLEPSSPLISLGLDPSSVALDMTGMYGMHDS
jgi:hypothetical protein